MARYIKIENANKRDAEIIFKSLNPKQKIFLALPSGEVIHSVRVLKSTPQTSLPHLFKVSNSGQAQDDSESDSVTALAESLMNDDPEIEQELVGRYLDNLARVYINQENQPVFSVQKQENVYNTQGELQTQRAPQYHECNISGLNKVRWTGKFIPKSQLFNKVVLAKKYQIKHINGLTFDFLFEMAKMLDEKDSFMMLGGGASGKEPLVLNDGGKPYRAFLEGRVQNDMYCLILHLTDQELKPVSLPKPKP